MTLLIRPLFFSFFNKPHITLLRPFSVPSINYSRKSAPLSNYDKDVQKARSFNNNYSFTYKITQKYLIFLNQVDSNFKKTLPAAHKFYKSFMKSSLEFFKDSKIYYGTLTKIKLGISIKQLTAKELHLFHEMPTNLIKSIPLIISILVPFAHYFLIPIAYYMYPKILLSHHFWTDEQRKKFVSTDLKACYKHHDKVALYLNSHRSLICNNILRVEFNSLVDKVIEERIDISPEEVISLEKLFIDSPFGLDFVIHRHKIYMWHLCQGSSIAIKRRKLFTELRLLRETDMALKREGILQVEENVLKRMAVLRGINGYKLDISVVKEYLEKWISISTSINETSLSLLLHLPVLLNARFYN